MGIKEIPLPGWERAGERVVEEKKCPAILRRGE
jgi:hypothetical protein